MDDITLEQVIDMLDQIKDGVDFSTAVNLVDDRILDSFDILSIIGAIDDEFDVSVPAKDIVPQNFNTAQGIYQMVLDLAQGE
ncbi:acyl carrier protein [Olsenella porci]|uniref:Acyl carrier protein n=1 Tax=Olsenella porci TaxID=2652279 RepID=A0A6N7XS16_9ACTN|nr:acyl carrier protein [Olsenella porci]MST72719.1 acyl carrier protein [Olsenella porci]